MFRSCYQLVDRRNIAVTRPALERAGWRCERCKREDDLRVLDHRKTIKVLCNLCRVQLDQPVFNGGFSKATKVAAVNKTLAASKPKATTLEATRAPVDQELKELHVPDDYFGTQIQDEPIIESSPTIDVVDTKVESLTLPILPSAEEEWCRLSYSELTARATPESNAIWILRNVGPFSTAALIRQGVSPETLESLVRTGQVGRHEYRERTIWRITPAYEKYLREEERELIKAHRGDRS